MLFLKFEAIFGQSWSQRHANEEAWSIAKQEWGDSLGKYANDLEIIRKAIETMKTQNRSFPPNLIEFLDICKSCEPSKPASGFFEASEEFKKKYYEWDHKPIYWNGNKSHGSEISRNKAGRDDLQKT